MGKNVLRILPSKIKNLCPKTKKIVVIMDKNVPTIYRRKNKKKFKKYEVIFYNFNANEKSKSLKSVSYFLNKLLTENLIDQI